MDSHAFLENPEKHKLPHVYILHGEEEFLKRQVLSALRARVLESAENSFGLSTYSGDRAQFAEVNDELQTLPSLGTHRLAVVENADPVVALVRPSLDKYAAQPAS